MINLDLKDKKILYELDRNARQTNSQIARKVRLNKNTVNYKIKRLEKEGAILNYYTMIDNSKLGYFSFRVYIKFFNTTSEKEKEIIDWLKNNKLVGVIGKIETVYNLVFMVWVKNIYEFDDFWFEFKKEFRRYFWNEKVHVFSKVWHFKRKYLLQEKNYEEYDFVGSHETEKYDEIDFKILRLLSKNGKIPIIDIAQNLKVPERTVAFRIKQLERKKIIQSYRINLNLEKIGYEYYKVNILLNDYSKYEELFNFAKNNPNIIYIDRTLTELDFEMDIEIKNRQELLKLLEEIKSRFDVRDMEIFTYKGYYKIESLPQ